MSKVHSALVIVRDDANSTMTWSGIPHHIVRILKDYGVKVSVLDKIGFPQYFSWKVKMWIYRLFKVCAPRYYSIATSKYYGKLLEKKIKSMNENFDFILAIDFTEGLPFLNSDKPVYVFRDASYLQLSDISYPGYEYFTKEMRSELQLVENKAFKSCEKVLMTSEWAIDFCQRYHGDIDREKYFVLPFSAQIYPPPEQGDWGLRNITLNEEVRFLFIGRDWERKGGKKAVEVLNSLHSRGVKVKLTVVGADIDLSNAPYEVKVIKNLDVSVNSQKEVMKDLYRQAHFFILPVNIEAFGIVFSEAMSFGLPVITHNVCALPEILKNGDQGICLDKSLSPDDFAGHVYDVINNNELYQQMQRASFIRFRERFHPESWVKGLLSLME